MDREYELILGCKKNDQRSQTELYELFHQRVIGFIIKRMKSDEHVDEIVSMVFIRIFKKMELFTFKGSFFGWVTMITRHCMYDYINGLNSENRIITFVDDVSDDAFGADSVVFSHSSTNEGETTMILTNHMEIIDQTLTEREKSIFMLYYEGYKHREIAESLNISVGTSKWHVNNARNKLKEKISKESLFSSK